MVGWLVAMEGANEGMKEGTEDGAGDRVGGMNLLGMEDGVELLVGTSVGNPVGTEETVLDGTSDGLIVGA